MNEKDAKNKQIEELLLKARLPEPSSELKKRITTEASKAWKQNSLELSWQIPVRRLIASAAAAVIIVWLTNSFFDYSPARWRSGGSQITNQQPSDTDALQELLYSPLARHLVSNDRKLSITDTSALLNYTEAVRSILSESQQNGSSKPSAPAEGRSIVLPRQSGLNSYS
jgi:hypothetical protein